MLANDTVFKNDELSDHLRYDPMSNTIEYNESDVTLGVL